MDLQTRRSATAVSYSRLATSVYYFTKFSLFWGKMLPFSPFLENKQNSNPHPLCKGGGELSLQMKPLTIKTINFKFENVSFTKLQKKSLVVTHVTNKVNPPNHRFEMKKM